VTARRDWLEKKKLERNHTAPPWASVYKQKLMGTVKNPLHDDNAKGTTRKKSFTGTSFIGITMGGRR
jgi:TorA maturation chaperone TorD